MEGRLVDLEIRYTHLERQYAELSQTVFDHQKQIEALRRALRRCNAGCSTSGIPSPTKSPRTTERATMRLSMAVLACLALVACGARQI